MTITNLQSAIFSNVPQTEKSLKLIVQRLFNEWNKLHAHYSKCIEIGLITPDMFRESAGDVTSKQFNKDKQPHASHFCAFRQCFFCEYSRNLISMSFLQRQDYQRTFVRNRILISHPDLLPNGIEFRLRGGLYIYSVTCKLSTELQSSRVYAVTSAQNSDRKPFALHLSY